MPTICANAFQTSAYVVYATNVPQTTASARTSLLSDVRRIGGRPGVWIRPLQAPGDSLVIGCDTVSQLSAGVFEMCRIGDDTSGTDWDRTRKMGVNALAFRGAQSGAFYAAGAGPGRSRSGSPEPAPVAAYPPSYLNETFTLAR